jgi:hypothetical protein
VSDFEQGQYVPRKPDLKRDPLQARVSSSLVEFLSKMGGRDKMARFSQYLLKVLVPMVEAYYGGRTCFLMFLPVLLLIGRSVRPLQEDEFIVVWIRCRSPFHAPRELACAVSGSPEGSGFFPSFSLLM